MGRSLPETSASDKSLRTPSNLTTLPQTTPPASPRNAWLFRALFVSTTAAITFAVAPFGLHGMVAAALGTFVAIAVCFVEYLLRATPAASLIAGAFGGVLGALVGLIVTLVVSRTAAPDSAKSFVELASLLGFGYLGVMFGSRQSWLFRVEALENLLQKRAAPIAVPQDAGKLLDTSVLIDGRITDICEAQFLDGPLLVPQFVLHELQQIADSADSLRRQRGRRGLDVLERIRKMPHLEVRIVDDTHAASGEVDRKLVELAQRLNAKIVTNDFNLNKVASLQGISVLNINLLANAVRPAVLPGEGMRVFILREGKEASQGVAYLEDGTMVVVDGARRLINKTVDILVTSVHQTPAGKMIFGRIDERSDGSASLKQAAAGGRAARPAMPEAAE
jgi:uncharacterized protein YacL